VFVAASTRCFAELPFAEACFQIDDLEYDKVELWMREKDGHLKASEVAADPEGFYTVYREATRLTPIALCLEDDVKLATLKGLCKFAKLLRVAQITIPASPLGTPFNTEIDRLREQLAAASKEGIRLSIKTQSGCLTEDPHTAVELCQAARGLGLTLDPSYYICGANQGKPFDQVFPYVYHVHLRDTTPQQLQVQIGLGEIDYSRLINQLHREGYTQALSVEILPELISDDTTRALEMRKLRMLLDTYLSTNKPE
jgi:sugar phosphate isomerase/epimerase